MVPGESYINNCLSVGTRLGIMRSHCVLHFNRVLGPISLLLYIKFLSHFIVNICCFFFTCSVCPEWGYFNVLPLLFFFLWWVNSVFYYLECVLMFENTMRRAVFTFGPLRMGLSTWKATDGEPGARHPRQLHNSAEPFSLLLQSELSYTGSMKEILVSICLRVGLEIRQIADKWSSHFFIGIRLNCLLKQKFLSHS